MDGKNTELGNGGRAAEQSSIALINSIIIIIIVVFVATRQTVRRLVGRKVGDYFIRVDAGAIIYNAADNR